MAENFKSKKYAIVLAAGISSRMGICKTSLLWVEGKDLLNYQLEQWLNVGFTPVVVLGLHNSHRQKDFHPECITVINSHAYLGKTTSILTGLQQIPQDFEILAISAVDQPRNLNIYQHLVQSHEENLALITAPTYRGKMGHPLLFANEMRSHLANIQESSLGLRQVIQDFYPVICQVAFENPEVVVDINTPEIYQKCFGLYSTLP
ncbi:NTP transferase domain-containing protein [Calothrix sp. PCC 7507]|uniref:nucleotidyltransferase family protein n=1 Tax=Calothrix sp. PCC 7507 TaxID=99598 RepID=UPI00029EE2E1|nr:nucleotidyltransferase family protein [Calothrix sp. PCC 7507]AFY34280.1 hypothetical protein Cal7507_3892 [Calothrix sp. PCC 7507]